MYIYFYIYMLALAGQTAGPNGLKRRTLQQGIDISYLIYLNTKKKIVSRIQSFWQIENTLSRVIYHKAVFNFKKK